MTIKKNNIKKTIIQKSFFGNIKEYGLPIEESPFSDFEKVEINRIYNEEKNITSFVFEFFEKSSIIPKVKKVNFNK